MRQRGGREGGAGGTEKRSDVEEDKDGEEKEEGEVCRDKNVGGIKNSFCIQIIKISLADSK